MLTCVYLCLPGSPTTGWSDGQRVPGWVCPDFTWRDRDGAGTEHQDVPGITLLTYHDVYNVNVSMQNRKSQFEILHNYNSSYPKIL